MKNRNFSKVMLVGTVAVLVLVTLTGCGKKKAQRELSFAEPVAAERANC